MNDHENVIKKKRLLILLVLKNKDEQNVKRRVYDALNVLISANLLKKEGKIVRACEETFLVGKKFTSNNRCYDKEKWIKKIVLLFSNKKTYY